MATVYFRVSGIEQLKAVCSEDIAHAVICRAELFQKASGLRDDGASDRLKIYIDLPDIMRENRSDEIAEMADTARCADGLVIKNIDEMGLVISSGYDGEILADPFLYAYNKEAVSLYRSLFPDMRFIAADELTDAELLGLWKPDEVIYKVYGRQRVMFTAQDFHENFGQKENVQLHMESARKDRFVIMHEEDYDTVLTEQPVSMLSRLDTLPWSSMLIDLTCESGRELEAVLSSVRKAFSGKMTEEYGSTFGHHFKGID